MNSSACSVVICQPGGHEQKHDITVSLDFLLKVMIFANFDLKGIIFAYFGFKVALKQQFP